MVENMTTEKIIITGGLGFLGSTIAKKFFHKFKIVIIDKVDIDKQEINRISKISDQIIYKKIDLSAMTKEEMKWLSNELIDTAYFFHFAASVGVKSIDKNPQKSIIQEYKVNMTLLPMLAKNKTRTFFASSSEVYGNQDDCKETQELIIGPPNILRWGYACNKLMTEFLIRSYNIPHTILRLFNVTGKSQSAEQGMVIPKMVKDASEKGTIFVYGEGTQTRAFCHVADFSNAIERIVDDNLFENEIVNIGNDQNKISIYELAKKVKEHIRPDAKIVFKRYDEEYSKESKDIYRRSPDTTKLKTAYSPKLTIDDIILSFKSER